LFYPRDPARLQREVLELMGGGVSPPSKVLPKALIAPHAGYVYSGRVAGAAFAKLRASGQTITRVVLIGPAHYVDLKGIAAPRVDAFETPLSRVPVDTETCSRRRLALNTVRGKSMSVDVTPDAVNMEGGCMI
jgi:MEMO1 family protein